MAHPAPLRVTGAVSVSHAVAGTPWQAWVTCAASARPVALNQRASFQPVGAAGLKRAADRLAVALGSGGEAGQTGRDLAALLRRWPAAQVWLDPARGVLVAADASWHAACVLVTNVPLLPGPV